MTDRTTSVNLGARFFVPFLVGDLLLLAAAAVIWQQAQRPMTAYEVGAFAGCVALGAWLGVWPFRLRHHAELKLTETAALTDTLRQIQQVEDVAGRIHTATSQWQAVQEHAGRTMTAAREVQDRMTAEQREFRAFMEKAADTERNHLRLEVNKLRRAEGDWLQVLVRVLDHVYALYLGGVRSGQPQLIEQFTHFQNACRDAARRVGMVPILAAPDTPFDPELHQLPDPDVTPAAGSRVIETLATGHTFQGQLLRRAVVALQTPPAPVPTTSTVGSFSTQPPSPAMTAPEGRLTEEALTATGPTGQSDSQGAALTEALPLQSGGDAEGEETVPGPESAPEILPEGTPAPTTSTTPIPPVDEAAREGARPGQQPELLL